MAISKITSNAITDGAVTADDLATGAVEQAMTTQIGGRRNLIINGAMQVAQRGASFTPTTINTYSLDRWRSEGYSYDVDVTQQTFTSGQTDVDGFPVNYVTVALNETISTGEYWSFQQRIEKPQMILEGSQTFTLSFWARATTGTVSADTFSYGIGAREGNPELTTTWQKITYTFTTTISSSGSYASCYLIYFAAGTTATSIDIAQVQLEVGSVATPFEHRSYGEELALCQRYYQELGRSNQNQGILVGMVRNSHFTTGYNFVTTMRSGPTITTYGSNSTTGTIQAVFGSTVDASHTANSADVVEEWSNKDGFRFRILSTSGPNGDGAYIDLGTASSQVSFTFDAEL